MATFTIPLKDVIEIQNGDIGLNDYPIFDEDYREPLNQKIINHFWNQEIGQETISMFTFALKRKMNEIMPLYNEQYKLSLLTVDPLSTVNVRNLTTTDGTTSTTGNSTNTSTSNAKARAVASETPQTQLMPEGDYASSMQDNTSVSDAEGTATDAQSSTQDGTVDNTTSGYQGHAPLLVLQARQALVNVDMMVIEELKSLFMLIWSNNDEYTERHYPYYGFF